MIKFLIDENIPPAITQFLQQRGFKVKDVREAGLSGASDRQLMSLAQQEERIIVTFDKHFADILRYPPSTHFGVIRIRITPPLLADIIQALAQFLQQFDLTTLKATLVVLEREGVRLRR